jgi:hypothetical protein
LSTAGGFTHGIGRIGRVPLGCEETEFAIRARRLVPGSRILHVPDAAVEHLVPTDRQRLRYFMERCWAEGMSKAIVSSLAGPVAGLSSERAYATRVLPAGVLSGLADGARGDAHGLRRAVTIVLGLAITAVGYLRGKLAVRAASKPQGAV